MYGVNMETVHMINRMEADARKKAMYYPELRKSAAMARKQRDARKYIDMLKKNVLKEC